MSREYLKPVIISLTLLTLIVAGVYWITSTSGENDVYNPMVPISDSNLDLGISYMTVTPGMASYHQLGTDSGALVTRVNKGGLADQLGIEAGEIIVNFNGTSLGQNAPLLGMMRGCHAGHRVSMDIWGKEGYRSIEFQHSTR